MPDFLKRFDGSGRRPRSTQIESSKWLDDNWHKVDRFAQNEPVGSGKSAEGRAIQIVTGGHVIVPSNLLMDQVTADYPSANSLKGKAHYQCNWGVSCSDWCDVAEQAPCEGCPYQAAKKRSLTEATFFNPMSLYYATNAAGWQRPEAIVVDEAHQLPSMLSLLAGTRLRQSLYKFPDRVINENYLVTWLDEQIRRLQLMATFYKNKPAELKPIADELQALRLTRGGMREDAQNYAIYLESGTYRGKKDTFLNIKPLTPPKFLVDKLLDARKIILKSGTLMPTDLKALFGDRPHMYQDLPSPIPVERRRIHYEPVGFKLNASSDPKMVVAAIERVIKENPGLNTIIHVSYAANKRLAPHFTIPIHFNDQANKDEVLARFKKEGGVFLASGCAEGIDLKDDLCRLNIIPQLSFPNLVDEVVKKRKALDDGERWYALETMKTTIQQAGRSTRGVDDFSKTVIMDPNFAWVFRMVKTSLPQSFKEAIQWSKS